MGGFLINGACKVDKYKLSTLRLRNTWSDHSQYFSFSSKNRTFGLDSLLFNGQPMATNSLIARP